MKTTLMLVALALSIQLLGQGSIPNKDFENWITSTNPKNWQTTTQMLPPGYITCQRTTNSYSGDYAIHLTTIDMEGWIVPGVITLGELGIGYTSGGIGFSERPTALKGFLRHPSWGDEASVFVQFYKEGNEIGGGGWSTSDSLPDYTEFTLFIQYSSIVNPDSMNITILTDQNMEGSSIMIDELHFEYPTTGMSEPADRQLNLRIHPNPCKDRIHLSGNDSHPWEADIYDLSGRSVVSTETGEGGSIDTSPLPDGTYVLLVRSPVGIFREKIIKQ